MPYATIHKSMNSSKIVKTIENKYKALERELDERGRRMWAAVEADNLGHGGIAAVAKATGLAESTIRTGRHEIVYQIQPDQDNIRRVRKKGGGRKRIENKDKKLYGLLEALVEPTSRDDPSSPLRWTCKNTRKLAFEANAFASKITDREWTPD